MDSNMLRSNEELFLQIKSEIETEIKTEESLTYHNGSLQYYQQCIIKEEVMLPSDSEGFADDESESKSHDNETKHAVFKINDVDFNKVISKYGKANCSKCDKQFKAVSRKTRCKLCSNVYRYSCSTCLDSNYKTFSDLRQHIKLHHATLRELYTCSACNKSFKQRKRLKEHLKVCGYAPKFKCELCPYVARYKCNLVNHVKCKHKTKSSSCQSCGKTYTHERSMRRHVKYYCGKRKSFECEHCDFAAFRKDQMVQHLKLKHPKLFLRSVWTTEVIL